MTDLGNLRIDLAGEQPEVLEDSQESLGPLGSGMGQIPQAQPVPVIWAQPP